MAKLAPHCKKHALEHTGCSSKADEDARKACKTLEGKPSWPSCMSNRFDYYLVEYCKDIVCPGDPFALASGTVQTAASTTMHGAAEVDASGHRGGFSTQEAALAVRADFEKGSGAGKGLDPNKVRLAVGLGLGLLALIYFVKR